MLRQIRQFFRPISRHLSTSNADKSFFWSSVSINRSSCYCLASDFLVFQDAARQSGHSALLSGVPQVYEIVSESVSPANWEDYLAYKAESLDLCKSREGLNVAEHLGSWNYIYGDVVFRAMHMYKYPNGFGDIDLLRKAIKSDSEFQKRQCEGFKIINQQSTEFLKSFAYWPAPQTRSGGNIYDVRSYRLNPGHMYDWGNYWAKGIKCRREVREDTLFGGFFTQVGHLQTVYHIWVYKDMKDRKTCRESTWKDRDWHSVVANTVPLIKSMKTRILEPLPFSPTQ